ncbi:MAG: hypothetical protein ACT4N2_12980 [Hyphomicrobium sp.]
MTRITLAVLATALVATASPVFAKEDCDAGFRAHMSKMTTYVDKTPANDLADAIRRSLDAYSSCKAGDSFSPKGVWDKVEADLAAKSK